MLRKVAIGLKSLCPSAALTEAALVVLSRAACIDIFARRRVEARLRYAFRRNGRRNEGAKGKKVELGFTDCRGCGRRLLLAVSFADGRLHHCSVFGL